MGLTEFREDYNAKHNTVGPYILRQDLLTNVKIKQHLKEVGFDFSLNYISLIDRRKTQPSYNFLQAMKWAYGEGISIKKYFLEDNRIWKIGISDQEPKAPDTDSSVTIEEGDSL